MAPNFSDHSSPESIRPQVEAIISQATDLCVLEHIAALNTAHISDDASLPTQLENRFRKLKSFPEANPQRRTITTTPNCTSPSQEEEIVPKSLKVSQSLPISSSLGDPKPEHAAADEDQITSSAEQETAAVPVPDSKLKKKSEHGSSPSGSIDSSRGSPSPPRQTCCFCCYSKKDMKKKTKGIEGWWENDEILSSIKEQQRKLKKALKEQEKANQEADKMVKWIKQASARMNSAAIDELLSDDEEFK